MPAEEFPRMMLLNRLESRSYSSAPSPHKPPPHAGSELFAVLKQRMDAGQAVEAVGSSLGAEEDDVEGDGGSNRDLLQICDLTIDTVDSGTFVSLLIQHVDATQRSFPVVDMATLKGRELEGKETERGARAAHIVVKLPSGEEFDDGHYRCVIEHVDGIRRRDIETIFRRQLRRHAKENDYSFQVVLPGKRKPLTKNYKYYPRLHLNADVGRSIESGISIENLSTLLFTKRADKQVTGGEVSVIHTDVLGDVEIRISAAQAPKEKKDRLAWVEALVTDFKERGYNSRLYYRHGKAGVLSGTLDKAVEGAMDLLMCPKQIVTIASEPKRWRSSLDPETIKSMKALLDKDALWEHKK